MGRLKMKGMSRMRKRWLFNTVGVVFALGLVCVMVVTAVFAGYHYRNVQEDLYRRGESTVAFLNSYLNLEYQEFHDICQSYAQSFQDPDGVELQFIGCTGQQTVSSGRQFTQSPEASDVRTALESGQMNHDLSRDPGTGEWIMAVSCPMIYSETGESVGVLRFVASVGQINLRVLLVFGVSMLLLLAVSGAVWVSSSAYLGMVMTQIGEITDISKRIAAGSYGTQIQAQYDGEIGALAETINDMSVKISQNEKLQAEFISQLSHELRTPLTVINGWSETLLADESMDEGTRQGMKIISGEAKRLTEMVVELLDFTRMQDGRMTLAVEPTDILTEFEDTVFMYGSRLSQDGIRLCYDATEEEIPEIPCDPQRLRQVFLNILDNAAKHGGDGKRIDASIGCDDTYVIVQIRDYGPGIPEDEIPLVKKKFYKGSSSVRGTGIGLAVCDEIVELHGGTLTLENAEGGGTLVTVCLPIAQ